MYHFLVFSPINELSTSVGKVTISGTILFFLPFCGSVWQISFTAVKGFGKTTNKWFNTKLWITFFSDNNAYIYIICVQDHACMHEIMCVWKQQAIIQVAAAFCMLFRRYVPVPMPTRPPSSMTLFSFFRSMYAFFRWMSKKMTLFV